jgi:hypothetical protein
MQSSNDLHERHRHWQSDRDIRDDNNLLNVRHVLYSDEQETDLFEFDHRDHDLLERDKKARSRSERN